MDDFALPLKSQQWNAWFNTSIPMLGNQTPSQAAKTPKGRTKLEELLALYDKMRQPNDPGSIDLNIPTAYARWKLGYGPGSPQTFAEEEAILNYANPKQATRRTSDHTKKLEKKKVSIWVPRRCEVIGCDKEGKNDIRGCTRCGLAFYCGKDHQLQDWPRHKLDCNAIRKMDCNIVAKTYTPSKELEKFPIGCFPLSREAKGSATPKKCFICHAAAPEVELVYTECCNMSVCDNTHEYQMMSYARDFCHRSHMRYTHCSAHYESRHKGDWRECSECNSLENGARPFASTNSFCPTPCLEKFLPKGSMLTFPCGRQGCKMRMLPGHSSYTYDRNGLLLCNDCAS